jgi:hypothetical protein
VLAAHAAYAGTLAQPHTVFMTVARKPSQRRGFTTNPEAECEGPTAAIWQTPPGDGTHETFPVGEERAGARIRTADLLITKRLRASSTDVHQRLLMAFWLGYAVVPESADVHRRPPLSAGLATDWLQREAAGGSPWHLATRAHFRYIQKNEI